MKRFNVPVNLFALLAVVAVTTTASAQRPVTGMPVPELSTIDDAVLAYMDANDVKGAIVGISRHGKPVYLRGFGWSDEALTVPMRENRIQRVASITKTFTAAVIMDLAAKGQLDISEFAFDLDQPDGGILQLAPFPALYDDRMADIKVHHLLHHYAGWDRALAQDPTQHELDCQEDMNLPELPVPEELMRWIMGRPLQHDPGSTYAYSNVGYLALGLIAEQVSGMSLLEYVRLHLLTEDLWFPLEDIQMGFTFEAELDLREPHYNSSAMQVNVFDPTGPLVPAPYGSWNHELKDGYGRIVTGAVPLLHHAHRFVLNGLDRGKRIDGAHDLEAHGGAQPGNNSQLWQLSNGTDFVVLVNEYDGVTTHAQAIAVEVYNALALFNFPYLTEAVDAYWLEPGYAGEAHGSWDLPYGNLGQLNGTDMRTKIKAKPGSSPWTGVVNGANVLITKAAGGAAIFGK